MQALVRQTYVVNAVTAIMLALVIPNALFWCVSIGLGINRAWVNVDYLLVVILMIAGWRWLAVGLLVLFVLVDAAEVVGQVFPFGDLTQLFYLLRFAHLAPALYQGGLLLLVGWMALLTLLLWRYSRRIGLQWLVVLLIPLALANIWAVSGVQAASHQPPSRFAMASQSGAALGRLLRLSHGVDVRMFGPATLSSYQAAPAADAWFEALAHKRALPDRMLLVVVESWGIFAAPSFQSEVIKPLLDIRSDLSRWEQGWVPTHGNTVEGEIRELCRKVPTNINVAEITGTDGCLPAQLRLRGYRTYAFHGASGVMYDRASWYPRVGFEQLNFFETKRWPRRCFSFPGACDQDVGQELSTVFAENSSKVFAYWLTLNSHSPYDERDAGDVEMPCARFGLQHDDAACRAARIQRRFFQDMAGLVRSGRLQGVSVVVVGDHQPPMLTGSIANPVIDGQVPFLRFSIP